jgi:nanoRNase/pAp phosphatase (c-di-AMP/oligoRNAs hydrolase)
MANEPVVPLVIYHADCLDGIAAAWCIWQKFDGKVDLLAAKYGDNIPTIDKIEKRDIYIVDFSYSARQLITLTTLANMVVVLDHHVTAVRNLEEVEEDIPLNLELILDTTKSGCRLAWEYCMGDAPLPVTLCHIEDRDLWKWNLAHSAQVTATLYSYPLSMKLIDDAVHEYPPMNCRTMLLEGIAIIRAREQQVRRIIDSSCDCFWIKEHNVVARNAPKSLASEVAHKLLEEYPVSPFALVYYRHTRGWEVSLRSREGGIDVSKVAEQYGGGGHPKAAGFVVATFADISDA